MRATGIVRRIDELGRVVIPKEIRRTQRIHSGDALEIFTDGKGEVVFKKYSPLAELGEPAAAYADTPHRKSRCTGSRWAAAGCCAPRRFWCMAILRAACCCRVCAGMPYPTPRPSAPPPPPPSF